MHSFTRRKTRRRAPRSICVCVFVIFVGASTIGRFTWSRKQEQIASTSLQSSLPSPGPAFLRLDEKDGRFCGKEGDICKCHGRVRYGRLFSWSEDVLVDGSLNCSAANFGDFIPVSVKICKCYPTICTIDVGTCTPEPCECPRGAEDYIWVKKAMMTSDGNKCWACEKQALDPGVVVGGEESSICPAEIGRCSLNRACKCEDAFATKRTMKTKEGKKCWTCAPLEERSVMQMDSGQRAMFWMLPLLWPFMDFPNSFWSILDGCPTFSTIIGLSLVGYICQKWFTLFRLDQYLSFFAPCLRKGEFWRLFSYFALHSDLQHLCVNLLHLLDAIDLEGVPDVEVTSGAKLQCTRDGPLGSVCYPYIGIGSMHTIGLILLVLAYGCLVGSTRNFGALVQGASSICFGVDGALIALYAMFLGADLDSQLNLPEFGTFFWMRLGIIAFHIFIDIFQSVCGGGKDSVGTLAHVASLVAGFCYIVVILPPMGDGSLFDSSHPYIINCGMTSPRYVSLEDASLECLAFFSRSNGLKVSSAKTIGALILGGGISMSVANAIMNRHVSDDGIACCPSYGDSQPKDGGDAVTRRLAPDMTAVLRQNCEQLRQRIVIFERLKSHIPDPSSMHRAAEPSGATPGLARMVDAYAREQRFQS